MPISVCKWKHKNDKSIINQNANNTNRNTNGPVIHESNILEWTGFEYHCLLANNEYCWMNEYQWFEHSVILVS